MATMSIPARSSDARSVLVLAALSGAVVGVLGGLIGLGGAEFRLPLLIALFGLVAIEAVIVNKAISLIVVTSALLFRAQAVPLDALLSHWAIAANLLAGSLLGAWWGASWVTRAPQASLHRGAAKTGGFPYEGVAGAYNHARRAPGGYHRLKLRMS